MNRSDVGFESGDATEDDEADAEEEQRDADADVDDGGFGEGVRLLELLVGNVEESGEGGQMVALASHVTLRTRVGSQLASGGGRREEKE